MTTPRKANPRWPNNRPDIRTEEIVALYAQGESTKIIARLFGCCTRTVVLRLTGAGVALRPQGKFKRYPNRHPNWRGEQASYSVKHKRVYARFGRPQRCERCGRTDDGVAYDWANLTGNYNDVNDYQRMCRPCHRRYDYARQKQAAA